MRTLPKLGVAACGALMLLTLGAAAPAKEPAAAAPTRYLKIRVYHGDSTTPNVLVNLPLNAVRAFARIASRSGALDGTIDVDLPEGSAAGSRVVIRGEDLEEFFDTIAAMGPGEIVRIQEDDERVEIWIE